MGGISNLVNMRNSKASEHGGISNLVNMRNSKASEHG